MARAAQVLGNRGGVVMRALRMVPVGECGGWLARWRKVLGKGTSKFAVRVQARERRARRKERRSAPCSGERRVRQKAYIPETKQIYKWQLYSSRVVRASVIGGAVL